MGTNLKVYIVFDNTIKGVYLTMAEANEMTLLLNISRHNILEWEVNSRFLLEFEGSAGSVPSAEQGKNSDNTELNRLRVENQKLKDLVIKKLLEN